LLIELTVLIRHPGANHLTPEFRHSFGNADMGLQLLLASVPR